MKIRTLFLVVVAGLLSNCALSPGSNASVCPDCETVVIEDIDVASGTNQLIARTSHHCPGCQGALVTLFKDGKLEHRCSICNAKGFSCPITHPINKKP